MKNHLPIPLLLATMLALPAHAAAPAGEPASGSGSSPGVVTKVERAVARGAKAAASGVQRGVKAATKGVKRGAEATERGVKRAASKVSPAASSSKP